MNTRLQQPQVQDFITANWNTDAISLLLRKPIFEGITQQELVAQLQCKQKAQRKLPTWFEQRDIVYPAKLSIEQTSSETTAAYKSELVDGNKLLDATGGFGVDSFYFSKKIAQVWHCEINAELSELAKHNFEALKAKNIEVKAANGLEVVKNASDYFDWIYIDPSRRNTAKGKVFQLRDYHPNVPEHLEVLFAKTDNILIKTSPILDISKGLEELHCVKEIHIVAVKNEVKELLWILQKDFSGEPKIIATNLLPEKRETFEFLLVEEKKSSVEYSTPQAHLYEPNAAILKSGAFKLVGKRLGVNKLSEHSHLYTSTGLVEFPGRSFEIEKVIKFNKREIKKLGILKANITTRNFPLPVAQLRKELKIADGGDDYLFFTQNVAGDKIVLLAKKTSLSRVNPN